MAYQALYRRYRSQRFEEVLGQDHVTTALRNAVREGRVGQGYLFSGPRGTGKTSTARILAKVLNCEHPEDGEPDTTCEQCVAVQEGRTVDWLHELDAASNNGVDAMRDLIARAGMGTSGARKVYILDEVHMLTAAASNALLKTLEEPPDHVIFVLATTEPEKVLPTIRSRTQHFAFHLLPADVLADHVRRIIADAGLDLGEDAVEHVVRAGRGSARDALSALDQVAAAGGVLHEGLELDAVVDALAARDPGATLVAVDTLIRSGREPRTLGAALVDVLRHAFLAAMGAPAGGITDAAAARAAEVSEAMGPAVLTHALESIGTALVDMRQAPDPRIPLEVALIQIARPEAAGDVEGLARRVAALEAALAGGGTPAPAGSDPAAGGVSSPADRADSGKGADAARAARARLADRHDREDASPEPVRASSASPGSRPTLGGVREARQRAGHDARTDDRSDGAPAEPPPATDGGDEPTPAGGDAMPGPEELMAAWNDEVHGSLRGRAKALYKPGRFVPGDGRVARFALPNEPHRKNCLDKLDEVRTALEDHFGQPIPLELVVDDGDVASSSPSPGTGGGGAGPSASSSDDEVVDLDGLTDAPDASVGGVAKLQDAFPGAELLDE